MLTAQFAFADSGQGNLADIAEKLLPTVVSIEATQKSTESNGNDPNELLKQFFGHQNPSDNGSGTEPTEATLQGSSFIIDPAGYVVTNNHIIERAEKITVRAENSTEYKAQVIGHDPGPIWRCSRSARQGRYPPPNGVTQTKPESETASWQ
jgi:serine protease Do